MPTTPSTHASPLRRCLNELVTLNQSLGNPALTLEEKDLLVAKINDEVVLLMSAPALDKADLYARLDFIAQGTDDSVYFALSGQSIVNCVERVKLDIQNLR